MPISRKPLELPPKVARAFVDALRDFVVETDRTKQDAIAAHTLKMLKEYDDNLRLSDIRVMFEQMKSH
jgi:uncharacterized protein YbaP (TraB family)